MYGAAQVMPYAALCNCTAQSLRRCRRGFALFDNWRSRIKGLGVAFGTKLVHFAASPCEVKPTQLIYDRFVALALRDVEGPSFPLATARVLSSDYLSYLVWLKRPRPGVVVVPKMWSWHYFDMDGS